MHACGAFNVGGGAGGAEDGKNLVRRRAVEEVGAACQQRKAEAGRVEGHALDGERGFAGLVERQLQVVAVEQVDAVERCILRSGGDLRDDVVVLADKVGADGLRSRIGNWRGGSAEGRAARR